MGTKTYEELIAEIDDAVSKLPDEPPTPDQLREYKISMMIGFSPSDREMSREEAERFVDATYGFVRK